MAGGYCLHHGPHVHTPCNCALVANLLMHCFFLFYLFITKKRARYMSLALPHCTRLSCLHSYHVLTTCRWLSEKTLGNKCWTKLEYCRWPCLSDMCCAQMIIAAHSHVGSRYAGINKTEFQLQPWPIRQGDVTSYACPLYVNVSVLQQR